MPKFSILIPSYNHSAFLAEAVGSVLSQTEGDWELIAIDDQSTDSSLEILQGFNDSRIQVLSNPANLGTYGTLARGLELANGELISILNSDDIWSDTKLAAQRSCFDEHPEISACYTDGAAFGDPHVGLEDVHGDWPTLPVQELLPCLLEHNRVLASSAVFRRESAWFNSSLRYSGDWCALLKASWRAPVGFVSDKLTRWRIHGHNNFVRSSGQVAEEIRVRQSILAGADRWRVRDIPETQIREGLSHCAIHLSALLVLEGRMQEARMAARVALSLKRSLRTLKRLAVVSLSHAAASNRLWPGSDKLEPSDSGALLNLTD